MMLFVIANILMMKDGDRNVYDNDDVVIGSPDWDNWFRLTLSIYSSMEDDHDYDADCDQEQDN